MNDGWREGKVKYGERELGREEMQFRNFAGSYPSIQEV